MSAIVFVGESIPEPKLIKTLIYKAYLSKQEQDNIIEELKRNVPDIDDYWITMKVDIELKKYK